MSESRPPCPQAAASVTCRECAEFLMDYLDGLLPEEERFRFESHIVLCRGCMTYLENYRRTAAMTASIGACESTSTAPPIPRRLVDAILAARRNQE